MGTGGQKERHWDRVTELGAGERGHQVMGGAKRIDWGRQREKGMGKGRDRLQRDRTQETETWWGRERERRPQWEMEMGRDG